MNITYETQNFITYLVCELDLDTPLDTAALGMLTNNHVPGLAPLVYTQLDEKRYLKYAVTGKIQAGQLFTSVITKKNLLTFLSSICSAVTGITDYMIDAADLLLDMNYIFVEVLTCKAELLCMPVIIQGRSAPDIIGFLRNILMTAQYEPGENKDYVGELVSCLNSPSVTLQSLTQLLEKLSKESNAVLPAPRKIAEPISNTPISMPVPPPMPSAQSISAPAQKPAPLHSQPVNNPSPPPSPIPKEEEISLFYLLQHYNSENKRKYDEQQKIKKEIAAYNAVSKPAKNAKGKPPKNKAEKFNKKNQNLGFAVPGQGGIPIPQAQPPVNQNPPPQLQPQALQPPASVPQATNFGDTVRMDLNNMELTGTIKLNEMPVALYPFLIRKKNNERIPVNKPLFRIGRASNYADYVVDNNPHVGSAHCHIVIRNGEYFIVDDNSTNHTYVNGALIQSSTEIKIENGAKVKLADEEFEFILCG